MHVRIVYKNVPDTKKFHAFIPVLVSQYKNGLESIVSFRDFESDNIQIENTKIFSSFISPPSTQTWQKKYEDANKNLSS